MNVAVDYRQTLKSAFSQRREKNPAYSLRSYARDMSVSVSMLSEVLNHKKKLTRKTAVKIIRALRLSKNESKLFLLSVDLDSPGVDQSRETVQEKINRHVSFGRTVSLDDDRFMYIADFRHLVLHALVGLSAFRNSLGWIAAKMGIFQHQAAGLMDRLKKMGIVESSPGNSGVRTSKNYVYSSDGVSSAAVREFHKGVLAHTAAAIESVPVSERDLYASVFAIDQEDFSDIQREVREFHKHLYTKYAHKASADRVYAVQNQFIPVTARISE